MAISLNVLMVEDSPDDAELLANELQRGGFDAKLTRVETESDFLAEIKKLPDIILSDYSMPKFNGLRAAELLRASGLNIPFILISGTVGEDVAVEAMKMGATDYLLKDRLGRLNQAIKRALVEAEVWNNQKKADEQITIQSRALEAAANAIVITDPQGKILSVNRAFSALTGYAPREVLGKNPRFLKSGAHDNEFYRQLWETVSAGQVWHGEMTNRRKDGTVYYEEMTITPVRAPNGDVTHFIAVKQDVTERKRADGELRWKTAFFEAQVNSSPDGILVVDAQKKKVLQNPRLVEIFRVPREIAEDKDDFRLLRHVTGQMKNQEQFITRVAHLYAHPDEVGRDEIELADGRILDRYSSPVRDPAGKYYGRIWAFRDITESRRLEEQFRQSQKMEAIGQLASGVAHDFNNILAVIQMQAGLLKAEKDLPATHLDFAAEIEKAAGRAANLTRQLLLFSRRQTLQPRDLDLNDNVRNVAKMLKRMLEENIQLQFKFAPQPLFVHADPGMLEQVLMNLTVNSRDAMLGGGGRLTIETSLAEFAEPAASHSPQARPGSFACLRVTDTGCGIPPEVLPRIFEPFFTTKDVGKGTGLGLATVFGIVQQHQGWIEVASQPGHGTTFSVFLPGISRASGQNPVLATNANMPGGTETILLVEDDAPLRTAVRQALSQLGYRVLEAGDGLEALEIGKKHRDEIHLLLTDLVMPGGITGKDLAARLLPENLKLKVIYASGYSAAVAGGDLSLDEGVNFLAKPFQMLALAQTVRNRLDAKN